MAAPGERTGGGDAAPVATIVCLHGLGRTPADWDGVRAGLERFGAVRAPRLPRDPAAALDAADAAILAAVLDAAGADADDADAAVPPGTIVIGHSIGAVLALRLARERPRPLAAVVLSDCFFPPARNGRGTLASLRDYGAHRVAYLRAARSRAGAPSEPTARAGGASALAGLARLATRRGEFDAAAGAVAAPVLVVHARDDHHVPLDFALAATVRHDWVVEVLADGGHHAHVTHPEEWLAAVSPWLESTMAVSAQSA